MNRTEVAEKKEKSMMELIIIVVVLAIMMATFIKYFLAQETQIVDTGFKSLSQSFSSTLNAVHGQWLMDGKPNYVNLRDFNSEDVQTVYVNKKGWIDSQEHELACQKIWLKTMSAPLIFIKEPVSAVEIVDSTLTFGRICRYSIETGQYFEYRTETGKVSL